MPKPLPPIQIITLAGSAGRRKQIANELLGLSYVFFNAVDGRTLSVDPGPAQQVLGRSLTPGEAGCAMSHLNLYEKMVREQISCVVVLEDDASIREGFADVVEQVCGCDREWDVVLLGHWSLFKDSSVKGAEMAWPGREKLTANHTLCKLAEFPLGTHGYMISLDGAKKMLKAGRPIRMPADFLTGGGERWGLDLYAVTPPVVVTCGVESTIGERNGVVASAGTVPLISYVKRLMKTVWLLLRRAGILRSSYVFCFSPALAGDLSVREGRAEKKDSIV